MDKPDFSTVLLIGIVSIILYPILLVIDWRKSRMKELPLRDRLFIDMFARTQARPESVRHS